MQKYYITNVFTKLYVYCAKNENKEFQDYNSNENSN